jgi:endonuclease YncB( thermonuclease family)
MSRTVLALLLFTLAAIIAALWPRAVKAEFGPGKIVGTVRFVVDGDTFYLKGVKPAVRVWGLDAPEKDEDGYRGATLALSRLVLRQRVTCETLEVDRYSRIVARCFLADGRDVADVMIRGGHAAEFCRYSKGYYGRCE